jgi:two-component system, chemotaxis family, protein-glutamate methylesterase/glutaminase
MTIKSLGGLAVVQDPKEAFCPDMPQSAIDHV